MKIVNFINKFLGLYFLFRFYEVGGIFGLNMW